MRSILRFLIFAIAVAINSLHSIAENRESIDDATRVTPETVHLKHPFEQAQLLVCENNEVDPTPARLNDLTTQAKFVAHDPHIATVTSTGKVQGIANGQTVIEVHWNGSVHSIPVLIEGIVSNPDLDFAEDVYPILYKSGCNAGACHASQYGKGGFTLSVFGFDLLADHKAIVSQARGRRISPPAPSESLLLKKPTMDLAHGGGKRLENGSVDYEILKTWIAQGAKPPKAEPRAVTKLIVTPPSRIGQIGMVQQLQIIAEYSDGGVRDVTPWVRYDSLDEATVGVSATGVVTAVGKGQSPVMARFGGQAVLATFVVPLSEQVDLREWRSNNFIDDLAAAKFRELGIVPSPVCDDATFLRRAYLDTIGIAPTVTETVEFLDSNLPDKRARLIDRLLGLTGDPSLDIYYDQYAAWWSLKWSDLLRNNSAVVGESGMWALHNWLLESFRTNKPFDHFVRELITAKGSIFSNGPANYYRIANNPSDLAESTAQLFLGTRLQCAKCHHHPYESYGQAEYYGFAAYFSRVGTKGSSEFGVFGGETIVMVTSGGEVTHPRTGVVLKPTPLDNGNSGKTALNEPTTLSENPDRRIALATWLTDPSNAMFSRNVANRYVAYFLGRGLVEPIDDMRSTNPPSNAAMLDALADHFRDNGYNLKLLMRTILNSRLYQLDSTPTPANAADERFYSHFKVKRIAAEPLLDCIDNATNSITKHPNLPIGTRSTSLPDANTTNPFLTTFGKPKRSTVCECERTPDENLAQALHMLNGDIVASKIADSQGRIAKLLESQTPVESIVSQLYLATLCRRPTDTELETARQSIAASPTPAEAYQDLLWALLNSKQFLFIR